MTRWLVVGHEELFWSRGENCCRSCCCCGIVVVGALSFVVPSSLLLCLVRLLLFDCVCYLVVVPAGLA